MKESGLRTAVIIVGELFDIKISACSIWNSESFTLSAQSLWLQWILSLLGVKRMFLNMLDLSLVLFQWGWRRRSVGKEYLSWNERGGDQHTSSYTGSDEPSKGRATRPVSKGPAVETTPDDRLCAIVFCLCSSFHLTFFSLDTSLAFLIILTVGLLMSWVLVESFLLIFSARNSFT